jgi:hypothetical protein
MSLRTALGRLVEIRDPTNPELATGTREEQRRKRLEWQRAKWAQGIRAKWPELPSARLVATRYGLEDTEDGSFYREVHTDPGYASSVVAYYERDGQPVMLEPANPFSSRAELERRQAAKEQRRREQAAARKARYHERRRSAGR